MSVTIRSEARIFHIAPECYIVYLGNEQDDFRPFLRLGNSRNLTKEIHNVIEYAVIADNHVGNPLLEIVNCQKFHGPYMGNSEIVAEMRNFFESFDLPSNDITDYRDIQPKEGRDTVWFYNSGNIHIRFEGKEIFDLYERARKDGHFLDLYELARAELIKNPVRYIRQDFEGNGIIGIDGNIFWYDNGDLLALNMRPGFAFSLMSCGIDPDLITALTIDLTNEDMASAEAEAEVRLLKRIRQRRKTLLTITSNPDIQKHLQLVFRPIQDVPPALEVVVVSGNTKTKFQHSAIGIKGDGWNIKQTDKPEIVFFDSTDTGLSVDASCTKLTWNGNQNKVSIHIPNGFPVEIVGSGASLIRLVEKYLITMFSDLKPLIQNQESSALMTIKEYVQLLLSDNDENDESFVLVAQGVIGALKRCGSSVSEFAWFYFSNTRALLSIASKSFPEEQGIRDIMNSLDAILNRSRFPEPGLPFFADLYFGKNGATVFWRMVRKNFAVSDLAMANKAVKRINEIAAPDSTAWKADYERLIKLIRSLSRGTSGPLTAEQLALLGVSQKQIGQQKPPTSSQKPPSPPPAPKKTEQAAAASGPPKSAPIAKPLPKKTNYTPPRRILMPLAIGLIALILGSLVWDITGKAPWGRILPFGTIAAQPIGNKVETVLSGDSNNNNVENSQTLNSEMNNSEIAKGGEIAEGGNDSPRNEETMDKTDAENFNSAANVSDNLSSGNNMAAGNADSAVNEEQSANTEQGRKPDDAQNTPAAETAVSSQSNTSFNTDTTMHVDVNEAPKTVEHANAYLNISNRISISEADIHLAANEIAVINGYKDLDYKVYTGADPDWIYPGRILALPDNGNYTIRRGDTIWFLAAREVRIDTEKRLKVYDQAVSVINDTNSENTARDKAFINLEDIAQNCRTEALRNMAARILQSR